jgi:hypothetical protein
LREDKTSIPKSNNKLVIQQSDEKVIERQKYRYEPFEFGELSVKKTKISPSQKLSARALAENGGGSVEDWLENLEFSFKNTSDKQITFLDLELAFPETGEGRPLMMYVLSMGIHPTASENTMKYGTPFALDPGGVLSFKLSADKLEMIKKFLVQGGFYLGNLNKATIRIDYIYFADGTKWNQGALYKPLPGENPGPGKPGKYERVTP